MSYLEELLPEFRKGAKIRQVDWTKGTYIHIVDNDIFDQEYHTFELEVEDFNSPFWELYKDPKPDWQYIIDNKCLCKFWDDEEYSIIGYLVKVHEKIDGMHGLYDDYKFMEKNGRSWINCRPVRRDEVTFYEDKKDE